MSETRQRHAGAPQCLHCCLWDAINGYFRAAGQIDPSSGKLIYDERIIYGHMADVLAEVVAGIPTPSARLQRISAIGLHLRKRVTQYVKSGEHVQSKRVELS